MIMAYFIYQISNEKQTAIAELNTLNSEVGTLDNTVSSLQNVINHTLDNTNSQTSSSSNSSNLNSNTSNTTSQATNNVSQPNESECKTALLKYLDCIGTGSPISELVVLDFLTYDQTDSATRITIDNKDYLKTTIKYSDFKNTVLNYVTEDFFNNKFPKGAETPDGYVAFVDGGKSGATHLINNMTLVSNQNNLVQYEVAYVYSESDESNGEKRKLQATFEKASNGHYLLSNVEFENHF